MHQRKWLQCTLWEGSVPSCNTARHVPARNNGCVIVVPSVTPHQLGNVMYFHRIERKCRGISATPADELINISPWASSSPRMYRLMAGSHSTLSPRPLCVPAGCRKRARHRPRQGRERLCTIEESQRTRAWKMHAASCISTSDMRCAGLPKTVARGACLSVCQRAKSFCRARGVSPGAVGSYAERNVRCRALVELPRPLLPAGGIERRRVRKVAVCVLILFKVKAEHAIGGDDLPGARQRDGCRRDAVRYTK
jgi:hypothetical protein